MDSDDPTQTAPPAPSRPRGSLTLATLPVGGGARVPLRLHWTLLLAIPYFAFGLSYEFAGRPSVAIGRWEGYALGLLLAFGLFVGVAIHELCHTLVGIRLGGRVRGITLMFLGGVSEMSRPPRSNWGQILMAAAGPLASIALAVVAWAIALATGGLTRLLLITFAEMNFIIGLFNLLPAYPLDGGRVLRGALVYFVGPRRATHVAGIVGRLIAIGLAILGLLGGVIFLTLVAVFIYFGAGAEEQAERMTERLQSIRVALLMDHVIATVAPTDTIAEASERLSGRRLLLVEDVERRVVGVLRAERIRAVPYAHRSEVPVAALMDPAVEPVAPTDPVGLAVRRMDEQAVEEVPVVEEGHLTGVVRRATVERYLESELADEPRG